MDWRAHSSAAALRGRPADADLACLAAQLGRVRAADLRAVQRVAARCPWGCPAVAEDLPYHTTGEPFPTLFYLTCPTAVVALNALETDGGVRRYSARLAAARAAVAAVDQPIAAAEAAPLLASLRAAERYERRRRRSLARGPAAEFLARAADGGASLRLGIGGVADRWALKCLHCHAAHALARPSYVLGREMLAEAAASADGMWCADARCLQATGASAARLGRAGTPGRR